MIPALEHPVHPLLRCFDEMAVHSMPPPARLVLFVLAGEAGTDANGQICGAVSLRVVERMTGMRAGKIRVTLADLTSRNWLVLPEGEPADRDIATPYLVSLNGRHWRPGER